MSAVLSDTLLNQRAEEIMLADVDGYAEWLSTHCYRHEPIKVASVTTLGIVRVEKGGASTYFLVPQADVPTLLALTLYPRKDVAWEAQWELRNRYLSDERLFKLAQEKAAEES